MQFDNRRFQKLIARKEREETVLPNYKYLIFDVDDTLLDFYPAFLTAQRNIAEKLGIEFSKEYRETDDRCGWKAWEECRLDKTEEKDVQENYHVYYYQYLRKHFEYLLEAYEKVYDAQELVDCYLKSISSSRVMKEPDTLSVYKKLSQEYKLVLATNGIERVQKERLFDFLPYTHKLYISEAIGMDVCYYNAKGKRKPENVLVDYEVNSIHDLVQILLK